MGMEDDFLKDDLDAEKTIEYIKSYLPQELKKNSLMMNFIISLI